LENVQRKLNIPDGSLALGKGAKFTSLFRISAPEAYCFPKHPSNAWSKVYQIIDALLHMHDYCSVFYLLGCGGERYSNFLICSIILSINSLVPTICFARFKSIMSFGSDG